MADSRWFLHPLFSIAILIFWLLLVNEFSLMQFMFGVFIALTVPPVTGRFWPERPRLRHPVRLLSYVVIVLWDILVANLSVARLIVLPGASLRPAFVRLPLTVRDRFALAVLTSTISLTPGTVSADLSPDGRELLLHCLDVDDVQALVARIKQRYESRLMEVFE